MTNVVEPLPQGDVPIQIKEKQPKIENMEEEPTQTATIQRSASKSQMATIQRAASRTQLNTPSKTL